MTAPDLQSLRSVPNSRSEAVAPAPVAPDAALLEKLRAGDEAAFEEWVRCESPRLLGTVRRIVRNDDDARDALQDVFLQAFRGLDRFAGEARLSTWLHRIAINAALMQLRRRRRHPEESIDELLPAFQEDGHRVDPGPRWPAVDDDSVDRAELRQVLEECYDLLPERHRTLLLLRDVEGLDTTETADLLGIGKDAVKMRLHRARQALRKLIEPYVLEGVRPAQAPKAGEQAKKGQRRAN